MRSELVEVDKEVLKCIEGKDVAKSFISFLDTIATSTGRATHYNTKAEQEEAVKKLHDQLFSIDRSIYGLSLLLSGVTDYSLQLGVRKFLEQPVKTRTFLTGLQERKMLDKFLEKIENQRVLKTFVALAESKVNNSRQRKLILSTILNYDNLEWWAIKYRKKVAVCLSHAWGKRLTSIICSIVRKKSRNSKEVKILRTNVDKFVNLKKDIVLVYDVIRFVFGDTEGFKSGLISDYFEARKDLSKGTKLPKEVLEGIRSTYHKSVPKEKILELTSKTMTSKQKMQVQKKAKEAGIKVEFNPMSYAPVDLYVYAFEMGMTKEIKKALKIKAEKIAKDLPFSYSNIGVLVDTSYSMMGDKTQKLKPMAVALAVRDVLANVAKKSEVIYADGRKVNKYSLTMPKNDTSLVEGLFKLLDKEYEAIFVLTDGYENAPAGRFDEVMNIIRKMGCKTPVYQITSVFSAHTGGTKELSKKVSSLPVSNPAGLGISMIKSMMVEDLERGVKGLLNLSLKKLEEGKEGEE